MQTNNSVQARPDWRSLLTRKRNGRPEPTLTNCLTAMCESEQFPFYGYSTCIDESNYLRRPRFDPKFLAQFHRWLESHDIYVSRTTMKEALFVYRSDVEKTA